MPLSSAVFLPLVLFVSVVTFEFSLAAPWLEKSCDSDGDCPDGLNATCYEGKCLCTPGYFYSNGKHVCVDRCPVSDQHGGFLRYPHSRIEGYGPALSKNISVENCLLACAADSTCLTVDYGLVYNDCSPNAVTALLDPGAYVSGPWFTAWFFDLYQKRCD